MKRTRYAVRESAFVEGGIISASSRPSVVALDDGTPLLNDAPPASKSKPDEFGELGKQRARKDLRLSRVVIDRWAHVDAPKPDLCWPRPPG